MKILFWKKEELKTGQLGEKIAAGYLKKKGYKIRGKNFKNPLGKRLGEIDIIAEKDKEIVFVEVKTRRAEEYDKTLPEESINRSKLHKLGKIANFYIKSNSLRDRSHRFDAVSVLISADNKTVRVRHIESIFI